MATSQLQRPPIKKSGVPSDYKSTLMLHGANVAMAPARSLTSHARRAYAERYAGRYRFSRWVFGFDLCLLVVAVALAALDSVLLFHAALPYQSGMTLSFAAAPLRAADDIPVSVTVHVTDRATHEDVRVLWHLPDWVQIVRAQPPIAPDGSVFFGRVVPGVDRRSLLVVHIRAVQGVSVPIQFSLQETDVFGLRQSVSGSETRSVVASGASILPTLPIARAVSGASLPLTLTNASAHPIASAMFRLTQGPGKVEGSSDHFIGKVAASSTQATFVDLPETDATSVDLAWQLEDQAQIIAASSQALAIDDAIPMSLRGELKASEDRRYLQIPYSLATGTRGALLVMLQHQDDSLSPLLFDVTPGAQTAVITLSPQDTASTTRWFVSPLVQMPDERWWIGKRSTGLFTRSIPFSADARYYSATGDQLGVGPTTPTIGQATRYWIVWSIDPGSAGIKDVTLSGILPPDVKATGQFASTISGDFSSGNGTVVWSVPSIPSSGGQGPVTFAFEAEIDPTQKTPKDSFGKYLLMATSTIEALDGSTGTTLHAVASGDDTF